MAPKVYSCLPDKYVGPLIVAASMLIYIPVGGLLNSFGVFVEKLNQDFCPLDCLQVLGWIGALTYGLNRVFCFLIVELQRNIPTVALFLLGIVLCSVGLVASSYIDRLGYLFLYYCVLFGFGSSLVMNSPFGLIEKYYPPSHKYHVLATSLLNTGAPIGALVINPLAVYLDTVEEHTWRDTLKIFSITVGVIGILCALTLRGPLEENNSDKADGYSTLDGANVAGNGVRSEGHDETNKEEVRVFCNLRGLAAALFWIVGIFSLSFAIFIPKVHFIQYMYGLNMEPNEAAVTMSYEGLAEAVLSFVIAVLGGPMQRYLLWFYVIGSAILGVASGLLVLATRQIHVAVYVTIHGAMDGILMTVIYPTLSLIVPSVKAKQYLWSMTFFAIGLGQVLGLPLAGLVYDQTKSYEIVFFTCGAAFSISSLMFLCVTLATGTRPARSIVSLTEERHKEKTDKPLEHAGTSSNTAKEEHEIMALHDTNGSQ